MCSSKDPDDERYIVELPEDHCTVEPGTKAGDGSLLRPYIVFFGENVPKIMEAAKEVSEADIMVIIGTSLNVYPAAGLVQYAKPNVPIYLIDPEPTVGHGIRNLTHIQEGASKGMEIFIKGAFKGKKDF